MGNMAGFHRIVDKTKCINDCRCFCYYSSASQVVLFRGKKKTLSHHVKESETELCLGSVKQYVVITLSEFSM